MKQINDVLITKVIIKRLDKLDYLKDRIKVKALYKLKNLIDFIIERESQADLLKEIWEYEFGIFELFPNN